MPCGRNINGVATIPLTSVLLGTIGNPVPGTTAGQFTISIDWGDGSGTDTSSGAVSSAGTQIFNVSGTHTYAVPGLYTIQATVRHADGRSAVIASSADIVGNALVASGSAFPAKQNVALAGQLVASFTDPEGNVNPAAYTASIHWGDGSTSGGAITYSAGAFAVRGDHTYVVAGNQALSVDITCPADGRTAQVAYTVNVAPGDLMQPRTTSAGRPISRSTPCASRASTTPICGRLWHSSRPGLAGATARSRQARSLRWAMVTSTFTARTCIFRAVC